MGEVVSKGSHPAWSIYAAALLFKRRIAMLLPAVLPVPHPSSRSWPVTGEEGQERGRGHG